MQRHACAPDLFNERFTTRLKFFQIRRAKRLVSRVWENYVGHLEIAHRPIVGRRKHVDLFCDTERSLSDFIVRSNIADYGGIKRVSENDEGIVARLNGVVSMRKCARNHDKRISRADEEAVIFQCTDFGAQLRDCVAQITLPCGSGSCKAILVFDAFQCLFGGGEIWVRRGGFLWPAVTGGRLEINRRAITDRHPIAIGAVSVHVHVRLEQQRFSMRLGMLKLQDSLAIEKVMPRKKQVEASEVFTKNSNFCIVKLSVQRRNGIGW